MERLDTSGHHLDLRGPEWPCDVAVDRSGNVYVADSNNNAVKEWSASTKTVTTLVSSGLSCPTGIAVYISGNVYIADTANDAVKEWNASTKTVSVLVSGLSFPTDVAVYGSGNVFIADDYNNAIKEWRPTTQAVTTLVSSGLHYPNGVAPDTSGNFYIADAQDNAIKEWTASTQTVSTLVAPPGSAARVATSAAMLATIPATGIDPAAVDRLDLGPLADQAAGRMFDPHESIDALLDTLMGDRSGARIVPVST